MSVEAFTLNIEDLNNDTRRWNISAMQLPNAKLERLEVSGQPISSSDFARHGSQIEFSPSFQLPTKNDVVVAYIDIQASRTRFQLNAAVFTTILGLVGTVFVTTYPDVRCLFLSCTKSESLAFMRSRSFGLNEAASKFHYTFGHKVCKNAADIFPVNYLESRRFWFALGVDDGLDTDSRDYSEGAKGPYTYSTGYQLEFEVPEKLKEIAISQGKRVQLTTILAEKGLDLSGAFKLGNLSGKARVVHLPGQSVK